MIKQTSFYGTNHQKQVQPLPYGKPEMMIACSIAVLLISGCATSSTQAVKDCMSEYRDALMRGDAEQVYSMLDEESRKSITIEDVRRSISEAKQELSKETSDSLLAHTKIEVSSQVNYPDGESATLVMEENQFLIASADTLPAGAITPAQALEQLRRVLARRSYAGFLSVLSTQTRTAIDTDLRSLVEGLEHPEGLFVNVIGDAADVDLPNGFRIKLRRESGVWKILDID